MKTDLTHACSMYWNVVSSCSCFSASAQPTENNHTTVSTKKQQEMEALRLTHDGRKHVDDVLCVVAEPIGTHVHANERHSLHRAASHRHESDVSSSTLRRRYDN
jgi:hypothetical protein